MPDVLKTQVAVIGAGPGGYSAGFTCADLGIDTVMIDPRKILEELAFIEAVYLRKHYSILPTLSKMQKKQKNSGYIFLSQKSTWTNSAKV